MDLFVEKNDKLHVLVLLHGMKRVYEIYIPFQWCPLYCMIIQKKCSVSLFFSQNL